MISLEVGTNNVLKNADATWVPESPAAITPLASEFGTASDVSATFTTTVATGTAAAAPQRSSIVTGVTSHGPYDGETPTTTGAVSTDVLGTALPVLPPNPTGMLITRVYILKTILTECQPLITMRMAN